MRNRHLAVLAAVVASLVPAASRVRAQAPQPAGAPEFEAASVKRSDPSATSRGPGFQPGGRFRATNVPIRLFIGAAYGTPQPLPDFQVIGGPDWLDRDRYDIVAKAPGDPAPGPNGPPPIMFEMMRTLLSQRFRLVAHHETRDQAVYALVNTRPEGKVAAGLKVSTFDCSTLMAAARGGAPPPPGAPPFCGLRNSPGRLEGSSATMAILASSLSRGVNRLVVDKTGLGGSYDFSLEWTPDQMPATGATGFGPSSAQAPPPPPTDGPSLFTALEEQLGLKLESTKAPVDVLVIDTIDRPAED
jgi:uncharacterized protein (TIGR03435 family)